MTIFTINPFNDDYINWPLHKFCMKTWERFDIPIKIFKYDDPEIIEAKEKFKDLLNYILKSCRYSLAIYTDILRLYILSKHKEMIWLDMDVYFYETQKGDFLKKLESFNHQFTLPSAQNYYFIYNGQNLKEASNILNLYIQYMDQRKRIDIDSVFLRENNYKCKNIISNEFLRMLHLSYLDNIPESKYSFVWCEDLEKILNCKSFYTYFLAPSSFKEEVEEKRKNNIYLQTAKIKYVPGKIPEKDIQFFKKLEKEINIKNPFQKFRIQLLTEIEKLKLKNINLDSLEKELLLIDNHTYKVVKTGQEYIIVKNLKRGNSLQVIDLKPLKRFVNFKPYIPIKKVN